MKWKLLYGRVLPGDAGELKSGGGSGGLELEVEEEWRLFEGVFRRVEVAFLWWRFSRFGCGRWFSALNALEIFWKNESNGVHDMRELSFDEQLCRSQCSDGHFAI